MRTLVCGLARYSHASRGLSLAESTREARSASSSLRDGRVSSKGRVVRPPRLRCSQPARAPAKDMSRDTTVHSSPRPSRTHTGPRPSASRSALTVVENNVCYRCAQNFAPCPASLLLSRNGERHGAAHAKVESTLIAKDAASPRRSELSRIGATLLLLCTPLTQVTHTDPVPTSRNVHTTHATPPSSHLSPRAPPLGARPKGNRGEGGRAGALAGLEGGQRRRGRSHMQMSVTLRMHTN